MSDAVRSQEGRSLAGARVALVGKLSGMPRREVQLLIRQHGGVALDRPDATVSLLVVGDESGLTDAASARKLIARTASLDEATRAAISRGEVEVIGETELWRRLNLLDADRDIQRLYTPAMLAELLKVNVAVVRRWQRRGLIQPVRMVRKLAYFDFAQVLVARQLAGLLASGVSPAALERRLAEFGRAGGSSQPLGDFAIVAGGRHLLRREGEELFEASGQRWFSFVGQGDAAKKLSFAANLEAAEQAGILPLAGAAPSDVSPPAEVLVEMAVELEETGELSAAADLYHAALAAGGANAEACFAMAELFYRMGDLSAARERYFMAIELDENYVEARANLGCLLAEQGKPQMAVAAFEGALRYHPDYADAHYHLARMLHELGRQEEALPHWQSFLELAPDSPWAAEVRLLLALEQDNCGDNS